MDTSQKNRIGSHVRFRNRFTTGPQEITGRVTDQYEHEGETHYRVMYKNTGATAKFAPDLADQVITEFSIQEWI